MPRLLRLVIENYCPFSRTKRSTTVRNNNLYPMEITRTSAMTGVTRTLDLPITAEQIAKYEQGALLQDAFRNLTREEREFYKTGMTQEEWDAME